MIEHFLPNARESREYQSPLVIDFMLGKEDYKVAPYMRLFTR